MEEMLKLTLEENLCTIKIPYDVIMLLMLKRLRYINGFEDALFTIHVHYYKYTARVFD